MWFGSGLGAWNGADVASAAESVRLVGQADREGLDLFTVAGLDPAEAPAPPIWTGSVGPKSLAVTGRLADGWVPPMASDWRSTLYRESRPRIDDAPADAALARWAGEIVPAVREAIKADLPGRGFGRRPRH